MSELKVDYHRYRITPGESVNLAERSTSDTQGLSDEDAAKQQERVNLEHADELQERLYAEKKQSLLIVLQAMDTGGKDSTIREMTEGINPQGCRVINFKAPSTRERSQDFLWRVHQHTPRQGMITIFNRSHYEQVLIVRVHQLSPLSLIEKHYEHINAFEKLLADHGTRIVKIMLHVSKAYQLERLKRRLEKPEKHWKFDPNDLKERKLWNEYMGAYQLALERCSTHYAPWYVIPAEERWFRDLVITQLLRETLEDMNPQFPPPAFDPKDFPPESLK